MTTRDVLTEIEWFRITLTRESERLHVQASKGSLTPVSARRLLCTSLTSSAS
jgi:hypothetical protein